jgi:hypothetical protein
MGLITSDIFILYIYTDTNQIVTVASLLQQSATKGLPSMVWQRLRNTFTWRALKFWPHMPRHIWGFLTVNQWFSLHKQANFWMTLGPPFEERLLSWLEKGKRQKKCEGNMKTTISEYARLLRSCATTWIFHPSTSKWIILNICQSRVSNAAVPSPFVKSGRPFEDAERHPFTCPGPTVPPRTCDSSSSFQLIHNRSLSCAAPTGDHNRGLFPRHLDVSIMNHPLLRRIVLNRQLAQTKKTCPFHSKPLLSSMPSSSFAKPALQPALEPPSNQRSVQRDRCSQYETPKGLISPDKPWFRWSMNTLEDLHDSEVQNQNDKGTAGCRSNPSDSPVHLLVDALPHFFHVFCENLVSYIPLFNVAMDITCFNR